MLAVAETPRAPAGRGAAAPVAPASGTPRGSKSGRSVFGIPLDKGALQRRTTPSDGGPRKSQTVGDADARGGSRPSAAGRDPVLDVRRQRAQRFFLHHKLLELPMFAECGEAFVAELTEYASERKVAEGEIIVKESTPGDRMFFILRGSCAVLVDDIHVDTLRASTRTAAAAVGEMVLLGITESWQATLRAASQCAVVELLSEDFERALEEHPEEQLRFEAIKLAHDQPEYIYAGTLHHPVGLFRGFPDAVLKTIDAFAARQLYFPGQKLMEEGQPGQDLLILVNGHVRMELAGKVVRELSVDVAAAVVRSIGRKVAKQRGHTRRAPAARDLSRSAVSFGELCFLGMRETRSASVVATEVCQVRVVYKEILMRTLHDSSELARQAAALVRGAALGKPSQADLEVQALSRLQLFASASVSREFLEFLASHLEDRLCVADDVIVEQGVEDGGSLWLVSVGALRVERDEVLVARLGPGDVFGEMAALGIATKRMSSVVAETTCYLRALHQRIVMRGLELFPAERQRVMFQALRTSAQMRGVLPINGPRRPGALTPIPANFERDLLMKLVSHSPLFCNTSAAFVAALADKAQNRIYMHGEVIVHQGEPGESMFVIVSGEVGVYQQEEVSQGCVLAAGRLKRGSSIHSRVAGHRARISVLRPGCVLGELAALGISDSRTATIEAEALTSMWEIHRSSALAVLNQYPVARRHFAETICRRLDAKVPGRIMTLPIFAEFPEKFRQLIALDVERRLYFPGQEIAREGKTATSMLVVNIGTCILKKSGVVVKLYLPGSHFSAGCMLGIADVHAGTLLCHDTCHILAIGRATYAHVLDGQPAAQASRQLIARERQAAKDMLSSLITVSVRKRIWEVMEDIMTSDAYGLSALFEAWKKTAPRLREERERTALASVQRDRLQSEWLQRRRAAQEKVRMRRLEELAPSSREQAHAASAEAGWQTHSTSTAPSLGSRGGRLPQIAGSTPRGVPEEADEVMQALCENWPAPKVSKFYSLRLWSVLEDSLSSPAGAPLLPLLAKIPPAPPEAESPECPECESERSLPESETM